MQQRHAGSPVKRLFLVDERGVPGLAQKPGVASRRFLLIVSAHGVRLFELKLPSLQEILARKGIVHSGEPRLKRSLSGTQTACEIASTCATGDPENVRARPCLVTIDNMQRVSCLALPFLQTVYSATVDTVDYSDYLRTTAVMSSGDILMVTELSAIHRASCCSRRCQEKAAAEEKQRKTFRSRRE